MSGLINLPNLRRGRSMLRKQRKRSAARALRFEPLEQRTLLTGWLANSYGVGLDPGNDVAVDMDGYVYVCGQFQGTTSFTPSSSDVISLTSDGDEFDAFVAKLDPTGKFLWAKRLGGPGYDTARRLAVDDAGNVFVGGMFSETAGFDATYLTSAGFRDVYLAKLNATDGAVQWAERFGSPLGPDPYIEDLVGDIALGPDGGIYLAGSIRDGAWVGQDATNTYSSSGKADVFLARIVEVAGVPVFESVQIIGSEENDVGKDVEVIQSPTGLDVYLAADMADRGVVIIHYADDGAKEWETVVGTHYFGGMSVHQAEESPEHSIYVAHGKGMELTKLDMTGQLIEPWIPLSSEGDVYAYDLAVDGTGVYVVGSWLDDFNDFDPNPATSAFLGEYLYQYDAFIWKLGHDGQFLAARRLGSDDSDDHARAIVVHNGDIYTTGQFTRASAVFDTGSDLIHPTDPLGGGADKMFVLKTSQEMGGIFGQAFNDLDNDGVWDSGEPPLTGFPVSVDDGNGVVVTTAARKNGEFYFPHLAADTPYDVRLDLGPEWTPTADGLNQVVFPPGTFFASRDQDRLGAHMPNDSFHYDSTDVPKKFPNRNWQTTQSTLTVSESFPIFNVVVNFELTDTALDVTLFSPDGTRVRVGSRTGSATASTFDFNYQDAQGTWTLQIWNGDLGGKGQLTAWSLDLCGGVAAPAPGVTVHPTSGLVTTEGGESDTFSVVLDSQPSAAVTLSVTSADSTEGTVSPESITFSTTDWSAARTVTVTGLDDSEEDGDVSYSLIVAVDTAQTADSDYLALDPIVVSATNLDDDSQTTATMHVADLDGTSSAVNRVKWAATVTILVEDDSGSPVSGATVQGTWSQGTSSTATTDANGLATVSSGNVDKSVSSVSFQVTSITHAILEYDSAANMDPDGDSDGTTITVYQTSSMAASTATQAEPQGTVSEPSTTSTNSSAEDPSTDDTLLIEQHTAAKDDSAIEQPLSFISSDQAYTDLELYTLEDELLEELAVGML